MKLNKYLKTCDKVYSATLDPRSACALRLHLVPPAKLKPNVPWVLIINGYSLIPLQSAWAVLLKEFLERLENSGGFDIGSNRINKIADETVENVSKIFKSTPKNIIAKDLADMLETFKTIAAGEIPAADIGYTTLKDYAKFMSAPHRMDLMVAAIEKDGHWNCNQKCLHCYCKNQALAGAPELDTEKWKKIIDKCRKAGIPSITFTGGEATLRKDLPELIEYSKWFVTRLNTNGVLLTSELCQKLYKAELDSVQVTLYSHNKEIHNALVGADTFDKTVEGIQNAVCAGLDTSVNTPLCSINSGDYNETLKFVKRLGVRYCSCSGLIPEGGAKTERSKITALTQEKITEAVVSAKKYAEAANMEVTFTSPGWINPADLRKQNMVVPACGACLSNMAISPDGKVIPCQSWLSEQPLGDILTQNWDKIWNGARTKEIRKFAAKSKNECLLGAKTGTHGVSLNGDKNLKRGETRAEKRGGDCGGSV